MNGVIRASVSPGSSQRLTSVTGTPIVSVPSGEAAGAGVAVASRTSRTTASLRTGQRIHILHALRQAMLAPRSAAVLGAEHLTRAADAVDTIGVRGMQGHRHHGGLRLHAVIEPRPRLTHVVAAIE